MTLEEAQQELVDAATGLARLIEAASAPKLQVYRDSKIGPATRKITKLFRDRFRRQRSSVLSSSSLRKLHTYIDGHPLNGVASTEALREAGEDALTREQIVAGVTNAVAADLYGVPVAYIEQARYEGAMAVAIDAGAVGITDHLGVANPSTESFISEYLKEGGFQRLTGDIDITTVNRLASAVADAYESGADFDGVVKAIKTSFADASDYRARMIAQTELNGAFNQSILHFGEEAGAGTKSWEIEPGACVICVANALQGQIPLDEDFESGDDAPTAHPSCLCSLMVHI